MITRMFAEALKELAPGATWSIIEEDYENMLWFNEDIPKPSKEEVEIKAAQMQAAEDAKVQAQEAAKASAQAKLAALGLTQDEIKAIVG